MTRPTDPIELYAWLKQEISKLEEEMDHIKEVVYQTVEQAGDEIDKGDYVLRCQKRPKYKFSEQFEQKNGELKVMRAEEIKNGTAVIDGYSEFVRINFKKG